MYEVGNRISGPVFLNYVLWVLKNAEEKNIKVLYFLARDGFLLYKIARLLCKQLNLDIECRYLYCSRYALRMPTYHFIEDNELKSLIFTNSNEITLKNIFSKTEFNLGDIREVLKDSHLSINIEKKLTFNELKYIEDLIIKNKVYKKKLTQKSIVAYKDIVEYFNQEKIFNYKHIGIVDSGWTGSMQRSLRQILEHSGSNIKITGFYFGLFSLKNDKQDGEYCSWYFTPKTHFWHKVLFCNNVLECMLSAPHEMTIGYQNENNKWIPKLKIAQNKEEFYNLVNEHIKGCLYYVWQNLNKYNLKNFDNQEALEYTFKILYKFTTFPSKGEVDLYNKFLFCDDVSEGYSQTIADETQIKLLHNYLIIPRIIRKILKKNKNFMGLFWPNGTAAYLPKYKRWWYRLNIIVGDILRYVLKPNI